MTRRARTALTTVMILMNTKGGAGHQRHHESNLDHHESNLGRQESNHGDLAPQVELTEGMIRSIVWLEQNTQKISSMTLDAKGDFGNRPLSDREQGKEILPARRII